MNKRKVLLYIASEGVAAPQRALLELASELPKESLCALISSRSGELVDLLMAQNIACDTLVIPVWHGIHSVGSYLKYYKKLFRYFQMYDFELVHSDDLRGSVLSIGLKLRFNVPLVWQLWQLPPVGLLGKLFKFSASLFCDHLVAGSTAHAHELGRSVKWRKRISIYGEPRALAAVYARYLVPDLKPGSLPDDRSEAA